MAHPTMEQVRSVNWGRTNNWDILLPDAPPLKTLDGSSVDLFPATDVEVSGFDVESFTTEMSSITVSVPKSITIPTISVTFNDDEDGTLYDWFEDWANFIYNDGDGVSVLNEEGVLKDIFLFRHNTMREIIKTKQFRVYPSGIPAETMSSSASFKSYQISFIVAGKVRH